LKGFPWRQNAERFWVACPQLWADMGEAGTFEKEAISVSF
jgi:hypothetical protein